MRLFSSKPNISGLVSKMLSLVFVGFLTGCDVDWADTSDSAPFRRDVHSLLPPEEGERLASGVVAPEKDEQPIEFDHAIHAGSVEDGGMAMDCQYCHSNARKSPNAGVPATQVCWNCHKMVDSTDRPALEKLAEYCGAGPGMPTCTNDEPIPWNRVHDLPDFVTFNHAAHIRPNADGEPQVACQECHGDMQTKTVAERESTLLMGWCLQCHKSHPAVNDRYGANAELRRAELKDCYTCHK
ncbi:MAG: cytochrome c3 family protein [Myxococcota bacterium]|nr:cytochrome c3 family protein [Myxococcota bacterium]